MYNINSPKYDDCRFHIRRQKKNGKPWDEIRFANKGNRKALGNFIESSIENGFFPEDLTVDLWMELVESERLAEEKALSIDKAGEVTSLIAADSDNDVHVPRDEQSSWQLYKKKLVDSGWSKESVADIEEATIKVLRKLNRDTTATGPVKGLMVGHVQSGKTANMAALMAMAADWGWNMFIVLSGVVENLRNQTERRLWNDLNHPGTISWISLQHLSKKSPSGQKAQDLIFDDNANQRYFTVCLKNKNRLDSLISWMNTDKNKLKQMKVIVIDDEADQAGINTQDITKEERATINSLIVQLVEGNNSTGSQPRSMNYISYTATPYSNFLNESSKESLYPKDFIGVLKTSNEYFGPKQIFGVQETENNDGLNIVREISKADLQNVKRIHDKKSQVIPNTLKESICWFLCTVASLRTFGYRKPLSMLVHTSQRQAHHAEISAIIENWVKHTPEQELLKECQKVYKRETSEFTLKKFREGYEEYSIPNDKINDYPEFSILEPVIKSVIKESISHIQLGDDGDLEYHNGIHLCIDNCANNGINDENAFVRLAYPDSKSENYPSSAPAFIIVGGSTLSRGLTIEGLVSTFFLRPSSLADSLMQMGRWFGYRKGYELFPRIWMTADTYEKFEFLATLEEELREDLRRFSELGASPSEVGPRVKNSPKASWLKITSKNKMQGAQLIEMDFTGTSNQTIIFSDDVKILKKNINITENFLKAIGENEISHNHSALIWRGVDFKTIKEELLLKFNFHSRSRVFNQIEAFCKWYEESVSETGFTDWNVVVGGKGKIDNNPNGWKLKGGIVGKVNRTRKGKMTLHDHSVSIGVLRAPIDLFADVDKGKYDCVLSSINSKTKMTNKNIGEIRKNAGLELTPQLLIYRIDKDSKKGEKGEREDLDFSEDIIGISLYIPGKQVGSNYAKALTVKISEEEVASFTDGESEAE